MSPKRAKAIKEINRRFKDFQIWIYKRAGDFEVYRKQNGQHYFTSYGRASRVAQELSWSGKFESWQIEVVGYDRKTGAQTKLYA